MIVKIILFLKITKDFELFANEEMKTGKCRTTHLGMIFHDWYLPDREECSLTSTDQLKLYPFKKGYPYDELLCKRKILEYLRREKTRVKIICQVYMNATNALKFSSNQDFTVYRY